MNKMHRKAEFPSILKIYLWLLIIAVPGLIFTYLLASWLGEEPIKSWALIRFTLFSLAAVAIMPGVFSVYRALEPSTRWIKKLGCVTFGFSAMFIMSVLVCYALGADPFSTTPI